VRNPEKFPAWIATIVRNRAHDILMRRRMIGVALAFLAPWGIALAAAIARTRNTGLWPVRQVDILFAFPFSEAAECNSAGRTDWKVCVP
jgi:hypothetical protein